MRVSFTLALCAALAFAPEAAWAKKKKKAPAPVAHKPVAAAAPTLRQADDPPPTTAKPEAPAPAESTGGSRRSVSREVIQRESRIEFDERMVKGQTAAGAIYLFERGRSEMKSMITVPDSFRSRTVTEVLPPTNGN